MYVYTYFSRSSLPVAFLFQSIEVSMESPAWLCYLELQDERVCEGLKQMVLHAMATLSDRAFAYEQVILTLCSVGWKEAPPPIVHPNSPPFSFSFCSLPSSCPFRVVPFLPWCACLWPSRGRMWSLSLPSPRVTTCYAFRSWSGPSWKASSPSPAHYLAFTHTRCTKVASLPFECAIYQSMHAMRVCMPCVYACLIKECTVKEQNNRRHDFGTS